MLRAYKISVVFNEKYFKEVWIDPHYEEKHSESINDFLILRLLGELFDRPLEPQVAESNGFKYYEIDVQFGERLFRMILVTPLDDKYLGVRNAYRRSK